MIARLRCNLALRCGPPASRLIHTAEPVEKCRLITGDFGDPRREMRALKFALAKLTQVDEPNLADVDFARNVGFKTSCGVSRRFV